MLGSAGRSMQAHDMVAVGQETRRAARLHALPTGMPDLPRTSRGAMSHARRAGGLSAACGEAETGSARAAASAERMGEALERRGTTVAVVDFSGRAGHGGQTGRLALYRADGDHLIDRAVERRSRRADPRARGARVGTLRHVRRAAPQVRTANGSCLGLHETIASAHHHVGPSRDPSRPGTSQPAGAREAHQLRLASETRKTGFAARSSER